MESCDVLIVGGGPAGSTCARQLKAAGLDVMVLDKQLFPRDKVCAGWITPAVVKELDLDCADYGQGRVLQAFYGFRTGMLGGTQITTDFDQPVSYGIRRCEFDQYLLQRSGVRLLLGEGLSQLENQQDRWLVNGHINTSLVIGAGGHFCPVARYLGARLGSDEHVIAAQELEFEMTPAQVKHCQVDTARPELFFCTDLKGYGWCMRKGDFLNIGLGREDNHKLAQHVADFRAFLIESGKVPADVPDKFYGHAYLLSSQKRPRPLIADHALLVGDACGLANPQSGEGIRPAIESGLLAARVIIDADGDYRSKTLKAYQDMIIARFGERRVSSSNNSWLSQRMRLFVARRLLTSAWLTRHVLLDRWFLHANQSAIDNAGVG